MPSYYIATDRFGNYDLAHYGVMGQKWGVRRYQDKNGQLTPEGRKRARKEYREDNKKAFALGRDATIIGKALNKSNKKLEKHSDSQIEKVTNERLKKEYLDIENAIKEHHSQLMKKYGKMAISDIKRDKNGQIKERVVSGRDIVTSILGTTGMGMMTVGTALLGSPIIPFGYMRPKTSGERGRSYYRAVKRQEKNKIKRKELLNVG